MTDYLPRLALPKRGLADAPLEILDLELCRAGDHLALRFQLADGTLLTRRITDEQARGLGNALLSATSRIVLPGRT